MYNLKTSHVKECIFDLDTDSRIPTNLRTLLILEALGRSDEPMTPTEINDQIGLPKQTIHRLCATLENEGFLIRTSDGKRLRPARRSSLLGAGLLHSSRVHIARHQVLMEVAREVKETVNFVIPQTTGMKYLDRVDTDWPFRILLPIGTNVPFHCTASGKAFMASMSPKPRKAFVAGLTLNRLTPRTHTSAETLLADLKEIRKRGYALDDEEFMEDMVAIAVPVSDTEGRFVGALAFHGPCQRLSLQDAIARKDFMIESAAKLTAALFS